MSTQDKSLEEIHDEMIKVGFPTFEKFCRDYEKSKETINSFMGRIDKGSKIIQNNIKKMVYRYERYSFDSLEKIESALWSEGINPMECDIRPVFIDESLGKGVLEVRFVPRMKSFESLIKV